MNLILNPFIPKNKSRLEELSACLQENLNNKFISKIFLLQECGGAYLTKEQEQHEKIVLLKDQGRKKFSELFSFAKLNCNGLCIIANSDIFFDESLSRALDINEVISSRTVLCQQRFNETKHLLFFERSPDQFVKLSGSADAWIFNIDCISEDDFSDLDFFAGTSFCDQHLANHFANKNINCLSVSDIICGHRHSNKVKDNGEVQEKDYTPTENFVKENLKSKDLKYNAITSTGLLKNIWETLKSKEGKFDKNCIDFLKNNIEILVQEVNRFIINKIYKLAVDINSNIGLKKLDREAVERHIIDTYFLLNLDFSKVTSFNLTPVCHPTIEYGFPNPFYRRVPVLPNNKELIIQKKQKQDNRQAKINEKILICATCRNVEDFCYKLAKNIKKYSSFFVNHEVIIVESNSQDNSFISTATALSFFGLNFKVISLKNDKKSDRIKNITEARNRYMQEIKQRSGFKYCLFLDADEVNIEDFEKDGFLSNFDQPFESEWDTVSANSGFRYYDIFALRARGWVEENFETQMKQRRSFINRSDAANMFLLNKMIHIPRHNKPFLVESAFNGTCLLKTEKIKNLTYKYTKGDRGEPICEHVAFFKQLKKNFINPFFINQFSPSQHVIELGLSHQPQNLNRLDSISIMSHCGEIESGTLQNFLEKNTKMFEAFNDSFKKTQPHLLGEHFTYGEYNQSQEQTKRIIIWLEDTEKARSLAPKIMRLAASINAEVKLYKENITANKQTSGFVTIVNTNINKIFLLLEADCAVSEDLTLHLNSEISNIDLSEKDWFILGSTYHGKHDLSDNSSSADHFNGVAVYQANQKFKKEVVEVFSKLDINTMLGDNYDTLLHKHSNKFRKKDQGGNCIESKYILNISHPDDKDLDPLLIKEEAKLVHQK